MGIMEVFLEVAAREKRIQGGKIISTGESGWEMDLREKPALGKNAGAGKCGIHSEHLGKTESSLGAKEVFRCL